MRRLCLSFALVAFFAHRAPCQEDPVTRAEALLSGAAGLDGARPADFSRLAEVGSAQSRKAEALFDEGRFSEGLALLNRARGRSSQGPEGDAPVLLSLARFHESHTGDFERALSLRRQVLQMGLPPRHPAAVEASRGVDRLEALLSEYREEDDLMAGMLVPARDDGERESRIEMLRSFVMNRPAYPRLAAAYYHLGSHLLELGRHGEALEALDEAIRLKPALGYYLPAFHRRELAHTRWARGLVKGTVWWALTLFLFALSAAFFLAKPWRWLGLRQAALLAGGLVGWWLFFAAACYAGRRLGSGLAEIPEGTFAPPVYASGSPDSPMSEALDGLFWYGVVGTLGAFVTAVSAARLRPRWTRSFVSATAAFALFCCIMTVFYFRNCDVHFEPGEGTRYPLLRGTFCYVLDFDQAPFILTNPTAYPGFLAADIDEPRLKEWTRRFAPAPGGPGADLQREARP